MKMKQTTKPISWLAKIYTLIHWRKKIRMRISNEIYFGDYEYEHKIDKEWW